jgi:TolB protein
MARLCMALVLATVIGTSVAAAQVPPQQPLPAHNGWIAFASDRGAPGTGRFRIQRLDPIGGRVTALGVSGRQPAWSPDGALLAFVQDRFKLVITRPDGTRVARIESDYPIHDPAWSPDGSRIVVTQTIGRRFRSDLAIVDVTRSTIARITRTSDDDTEPTWAPNANWIAFVSDRDPVPGAGDLEIYVARPDGSRIRPITSNDFQDASPAWSPDGTQIAFVSGRVPEGRYPELWTMSADGRDASRVQPASGPGGFPSWSETSPSWSPDGRWLVYVTNQRWYWEDIRIVELEGGVRIDLTPESASFDIEPAWQPICILAGTDANDVLRGTSLDELVCGHGGGDRIAGGRGSDRLFGGVGDDRISAFDRTLDVVGCGAGNDLVVADRRDLVGVDCERVARR